MASAVALAESLAGGDVTDGAVTGALSGARLEAACADWDGGAAFVSADGGSSRSVCSCGRFSHASLWRCTSSFATRAVSCSRSELVGSCNVAPASKTFMLPPNARGLLR